MDLPLGRAQNQDWTCFRLDYPAAISRSLVLQADGFRWFRRIPAESLSAIVTDPGRLRACVVRRFPRKGGCHEP